MQEVQHFLMNQPLYTIATCQDNTPWVANVYGGFDKETNILYFVSSTEAIHSMHIIDQPIIACNTAWFNTDIHTDRKAVQMVGTCTMATDTKDIQTGIALHSALFPEFAERLTVTYIQNVDNPSAVWKFSPEYIKFWNDELYGEKAKEFTL